MSTRSLRAVVVAAAALLAFAVAAGTVGDPGLRGAGTAAGTDEDVPHATEQVDIGDGVGAGDGVHGLVAGALPAPSRLTLALAAAAGAVVLWALWWRAGGGAAPDDGTGEAEDEATAVEGAAGGAVDPPAWDEPPDANDVYRAWQRLAERVGPGRPSHRTPAEYADDAREAGHDGRAVDELTRLFRRVRYGSVAPTPERERRAREALARVEDRDEDGDEEGEP